MDRNDVAELHRRACEELTARVERIAEDQWGLPTPCEGWDVRSLVKHLVYGTAWVAPLLRGQRKPPGCAVPPSVGIGERRVDDLKRAWLDAAAEASAACSADGAMERTVHRSSGDMPAREYMYERTADLAVHTWDLARAIGADERLDPELVQACRSLYASKAEVWRASGLLGPRVATPPGATPQAQLLAESGRKV